MMMFLVVLVVGVVVSAAPSNPNCNLDFPFCDTSLSPEARAADLVSRMTTSERVAQLSTYSFTKQGHAPAIARLQVPSYNYHTEGLHGIRDSSGVGLYSTLYPQVTAMAATGNMSRVKEMGQVMGIAARAINNEANRKKLMLDKGGGLSIYGPTMNLIRDPRWGRAQESVSEDAYLNGVYSAAFVQGIQGPEGKYVMTAPTCKHSAAYSLEASDGFTRHNFNAIVDSQDLAVYLAAFKACLVESKPVQVMCSYNAVNGVPACADGSILNDAMRGQWGWNGTVVSDCDAIEDITNSHKVANATEAVAMGLKGGCDSDCGGWYGEHGQDAYNEGLIGDADMERALERTFVMRFRLGQFDPPESVPYTSIPANMSDSPFGRESSLEAARESIALLNNSAGLLPLKASPSMSVAVVGPFGATTAVFMGSKQDYHPNPDAWVTVEAGLKAKGVKVDVQQGCDVSGTSTKGFKAAVEAAKAADYTVFVAGIDGSIEHEAGDRTTIDLPTIQQKLLNETYAAIGPSKLILVIVSGGPVSVPMAKANIPTVVAAFEGGEAAGQALADVLFGDVNPSGVLPYTLLPPEYVNEVKMSDMGLRPNTTSGNPGRTYRWYTGTPLWPFGYGESYTTFDVSWSSRPASVVDAGALAATMDVSLTDEALEAAPGVSSRVRVKNTGTVAGAKVIQAYMKQTGAGQAGGPMEDSNKVLYGLAKVYLEPGEEKEVSFSSASRWYCPMCTVDGAGVQWVNPGTFVASVGHGGVDGDDITAEFVVTGVSTPAFGGGV